MRIDELLRPELIRCGLPPIPSRQLLQELAERIKVSAAALEPQELIEAFAKRKNAEPLLLGQGLMLYHLRTEKVPDLTVGIAACPEGVADLPAPDGHPIRIVILLLVPKKHSELYLSVLAALVEALSSPEVMERVVHADRPEALIAALTPDETDLERGKVLALLSQEGALDGKVTQLLFRLSPVEFEELMEDLSPKDRARCLGALEPPRAAEVTRYMSLTPMTATLRRMPPEVAARILSYVPSTRCTDVLQRMNTDEQGAILKHLTSRGKEIQALLKYPPHTAGGLMMGEVLSVKDDATVADALKRVGEFPDRRQTLIYVTSADGKLMGWCQFHDLAAGEPSRRIVDLMKRDPPSVEPDRDQEELHRLLSKDDVQAIAVVGKDQTLLGVVTEDAILSAVEHEMHEDLQHIVGTKLTDPLHTPLGLRIRLRMPWLLLTLGGELFIALVISKVFRPTLEKAAILSAFMPAIMATGGNVGLQATTMVIRSLGMGRLKPRHTAQIVIGEMKLGVLLGLFCGLLAAITAYLINMGDHEVLKVSVSVFLAMVSATMATSFVGTVEPLVLHRLKFDPATACGPFVTMFNDMFGCLVYLTIAMFMNFTPPKGASTLLYQGVAQMEVGRYADAALNLAEAGKLEPENPFVLSARAYLMLKNGDEGAQALPLAMKAFGLVPENPKAAHVYGWALLKAGRPAEALPPLRQAAAAGDVPEVLFHLAQALVATGAPQEARSFLAKVVRENRDCAREASDLLETLPKQER